MPYRSSALTVAPDKPILRWLRVLAKTASVIPMLHEFRSVRRAIGGRWSLVVEHVYDAGGPLQRVSWRWMPVAECQGLAHSGWLLRGEIPADACYDSRALNLMVDEESGYFEHTERECNCEVWR